MRKIIQVRDPYSFSDMVIIKDITPIIRFELADGVPLTDELILNAIKTQEEDKPLTFETYRIALENTGICDKIETYVEVSQGNHVLRWRAKRGDISFEYNSIEAPCADQLFTTLRLKYILKRYLDIYGELQKEFKEV